MDIQKIQIFRYQLPFVKPLFLGKKKCYGREGLIVRLDASETIQAFGEIAPLPGFSRETLAESESKLIRVCQSLSDQSIPEDLYQIQEFISHPLPDIETVPSVKFGLQMALLNLHSTVQQRLVAQLLRSDCQMSIDLIPLLTGTTDEIRAKATEIASMPHLKSVKIKVGKYPVQDEINLIRDIRKILGAKQIRLDANRLWNLDTAIRFGNHVVDCDVLYVEEPLPQLDQCLEFAHKTGIGFALDETLHHADYQFEWQKGLRALIVKPMLMGNIEKIMKISQDARSHCIPTIISSSYESSLGLTMLANLAAAVDSDVPAGLDTYGMFKYDLQEPGFCHNNGTLSLESLESRKNCIQNYRLKLLWQSKPASSKFKCWSSSLA